MEVKLKQIDQTNPVTKGSTSLVNKVYTTKELCEEFLKTKKN